MKNNDWFVIHHHQSDTIWGRLNDDTTWGQVNNDTGQHHQTTMMRQQDNNGNGSCSSSHLVDAIKPDNMECGHIRTTNLIIVTLVFCMAMKTPLPWSPQILNLLCPIHPLIPSTPTMDPTSIGFVARYAPLLFGLLKHHDYYIAAVYLYTFNGPSPWSFTNAEHSFCQCFTCTISHLTSTAVLGDLGAKDHWAGHGSKWDARTTLNCDMVYFFFLRWLRAYLCVFYNMYTSRSFITSFLPLLHLCMLWVG